ncbi:O-antigen ligase [Bradyrhizobium sp. AUGA SZCCT0431]|uniref:O-antigen ligase family protein n=1 Tax=Bradyrhizobium sp. AUGA SZCCT0431 TaxID=2807674 RepID=UPI001BAE04DD|nr:O-antigen ligase family protein [Bradyrhizobium sp. AUGA SZCCT0431]MBR1142381.1 O-antigen ligase family protein [Bradyrhizobium sp. AUGA SZCCT0431]
MLVNYNTRRFAEVTAAIVTTAAFAKTFMPFYLVGSTPIFAATCAIGATLVAVRWRALGDMAGSVRDLLLILIAFYGLVTINFLVQSRSAVPITHLIGILSFHGLFLIFGFAAARALNAVLLMLLGAAAVYLMVIAQYAVRSGDLMQGGVIHDVFGVGSADIYLALHQNIGQVLGAAAIAALGLSRHRIRIVAVVALPFALAFLFHIAARGALVALVCSLVFFVAAELWVRSRKQALVGLTLAMITVAVASGWFYQRAFQGQNVDPKAGDAISRTIREIQDPNPGFRTQIWARTANSIVAEPDRLLFGRGIGMFPVNEGVGPPDWLLRKAEGSKHYPHNVYLEMLYETGIAGLLLITVLTLFPIGISLNFWRALSVSEKCAVSLYIFSLVSSELSGAFAFSYAFQFFFALVVGIIALKRMDKASVSDRPPPRQQVHTSAI